MGCAEQTHSWFLTLLSMIPSISLLALFPFFVLRLVPVSPRFVCGPETQRLLWVLFPFQAQFTLYLHGIFQHWIPFMGLFLFTFPSPPHPACFGSSVSRPLVPARRVPLLYTIHNCSEMLCLPSQVQLLWRLRLSALIGS